MKTFLIAIMLTTFVFTPCTVHAQTMSASTNGVGPNGFDWTVGTWSCTNSMPPSPAGGPRNQTLTVTKTNSGALMYHATGANFDNVWYNVYVPKSKTWVSPFIFADGSHGTESTSQTGATIVWTGTATDAAGNATQIRDTNTYQATKYTDLGEYQSGGAWKTGYKLTCTKS